MRRATDQADISHPPSNAAIEAAFRVIAADNRAVNLPLYRKWKIAQTAAGGAMPKSWTGLMVELFRAGQHAASQIRRLGHKQG